ncbi:MAG: hypothetical protein E6R13_09980 [Spirochaetes bacterium]|nr:MAG: hypothetical protein E6R13_09980 [Spirochaetota bacterium]
MKKIPTAKKFIENYIEENNHDSNIDMEDALIEFAKLHVEAALKEASEKALVLDMQEKDTAEIMGVSNEYGDYNFTVDKASILNSYSFENIK